MKEERERACLGRLGRCGAVGGKGSGPGEEWAARGVRRRMRMLGRGGKVCFLLFFCFYFPKHFPNKILSENKSKPEAALQNKICLSMNAQNHVTKLMINFIFHKII